MSARTTSEIGTTTLLKLPSTLGAFPTDNGDRSTRGDAADVIQRGIDLLGNPRLNKSIASNETCPTCGGPLTQGECLRCLVSLGFLSDSKQPEKSQTGRRLTPGLLKYDHFEVEVGADGFPVELGAGAMAITYRARDTVLNSVVALKVIDRKVSKMPGVRSRFLREARAAAQIRHPNVARVTHYGEQDGECFYVMELVEGETLETKVRRDGPMPLALALEVIEQATRALAAAEKCGVVHRDIKPSNIMLESDPSGSLIVKVIDYGIAKLLDPEVDRGAEQTHTGFIGTPAFASPEQFAPPEQTKIDTRSDIYSLGATFWYLLSGRVPFVGRTLDEVAARQAEDLPLEQLKKTHVPARVITLLQSMLAVDPRKRPQTARELLSAVRRCYTKFSIEARSRRKRSAFIAAVALLVLATIAIGTWLYERAESYAAMERSIAVLPFENLSPVSQEAFFSVGMQDQIATSLGQLADMKVVGTESTRSYAPGKTRNLPEIGRTLGVRYLLEGSVRRTNDDIRVALKLSDLRNTAAVWTENYEAPVKAVFELQGEITRAIATQLRGKLSPNEIATLNLPPTSDLQAYDLYLQALAVPKLVKDPSEQWRNASKRAVLLSEAIAHDRTFVLAYCELAKAHDVLYRTKWSANGEEKAVDHRALAESALDEARRVDPNAGQVHLALAEHLFLSVHDLDQARVEVEIARRSLPNSAELESTAGAIARSQGRWGDALHDFERAVELEPRTTVYRFTLANTHRLMRQYADFDRLMMEVIDQLPTTATASYKLGRTFAPLEARADAGPMRIAVAAVRPDEDQDGHLRDLHSLVVALCEHNPNAMSAILSHASADAFVFNGVRYPKSWYEGLAARMRGDLVAAQTAFSSARLEVEKAVLADATDGRSLSLLAMIDAGIGRTDDAVREGRRACELETFETSATDAPIVRCNLAVVYAWTNQTDLALSELDKLMFKPAGANLPAQPTYGDLCLNPVWDPLRRDPRFAALARRLAPAASK